MNKEIHETAKAKRKSPQRGQRPRGGGLESYHWSPLNIKRDVVNGVSGGVSVARDMTRELLLKGLDAIIRICAKR